MAVSARARRPVLDKHVARPAHEWFDRHGIQPRIADEFEDSTLLKTFGASGMGVFPAVQWVHDDLLARYGVKPVSPCDDVQEHFFAIGLEKKVQHPLVQRLLPAGNGQT